jgi:DsbC/DsbD-like thiol-disulfide interchange protein
MKLGAAIHLSTSIFLMGCLSATAQEVEETRVTARLVADTAAVEPGSTFRLGVHFEIEDGWHIYWRNPGGAGLATAVDFELPGGFVAGPLQWPLPIAFVQSEGIPGYGYEGSVVLAAEVAVPGDFDTSRSAGVRAVVSWLACKGVCVLGSTELETALAKLPADPIFREWASQLPHSTQTSDPPFTLSATGGLSDGVITHWLRWTQAPRPVEWFPDPSDAVEVGAIRIQTRGDLTRIDADVKSRKGASGSINELSSLLVVTGEDGGRHGWEFSVKLTNDEY